MNGRVRAAVSLLTTAWLLLAQSGPAFAYLKFGFDVNGRQVVLRWTTTPRYFVTSSGVSARGG